MPRPLSEPPHEATPSLPPPDLVGSVFDGRYEVQEQLGAGGFGVVYRARDTKHDRIVALKLLRAEYGAHRSLRRRFEREARALAALSHPNVVAIIGYGVAEQGPYLVMELLRGRGLDRELAGSGPLDPKRALSVMRALLSGLAYVHDQGLIHRDLKPGNVFMTT
ncbi:MAG: serine/threonine protein kinase, partial [Myxococcales bacterium]|nr:serine/threonine protein kinase [Myxococcales bacterium]